MVKVSDCDNNTDNAGLSCRIILEVIFKDVSREFDEFQVNTHCMPIFLLGVRSCFPRSFQFLFPFVFSHLFHFHTGIFYFFHTGVFSFFLCTANSLACWLA